MEKKPRRFAKGIMIGIALIMGFSFFSVELSQATSRFTEHKGINISAKVDQAGDPFKIIAVLEKKGGGKKLSERVRDKIFALDEAQIRLITSLCDRISDDGRTAGADITYFLITALIVLS